MEFVTFKHKSLEYEGCAVDAVVAIDHIVKLVPKFVQLDNAGQAFRAHVDQFGEAEKEKGYRRYFTVFDVTGATYSSNLASEAGQARLEEIYNSAL